MSDAFSSSHLVDEDRGLNRSRGGVEARIPAVQMQSLASYTLCCEAFQIQKGFILYIGIITDPNRSYKIFSDILYPVTSNAMCIRVVFSKLPLVTGSHEMRIELKTTQSHPRRLYFRRGLNYWFLEG